MLEQLLKYQEVDAGLRKIEVELSSSEERKKAVSAKKYLEGVEDAVAKLEQRAGELSASYEAAMAELEKMKAQGNEFKKALEELSDEGGANYLIKKTDEMIVKVKELYEQINAVSAEMQTVMSEYAKVKKNTKAAQEQYAEFGKKYNELKLSKQEERQKIEKELSEIKKGIDPALMEKYLKKRSEKIFPVLYEINGNICGACNMELPTAVISKLNNGEVIECDLCRRLLYKKN